MMPFFKAVVLYSLLLLVGCGTYPGVFFSEHTHFGLQVKINPQENKPVDVNMGYDRGIFTVVARTKQNEDASSVMSKTDLCVRFMDSSLVRNVFASGAAATNIASTDQKGAALKALFRIDDPATPLVASPTTCD